jgi:hypothetical protein
MQTDMRDVRSVEMRYRGNNWTLDPCVKTWKRTRHASPQECCALLPLNLASGFLVIRFSAIQTRGPVRRCRFASGVNGVVVGVWHGVNIVILVEGPIDGCNQSTGVGDNESGGGLVKDQNRVRDMTECNRTSSCAAVPSSEPEGPIRNMAWTMDAIVVSKLAAKMTYSILGRVKRIS